MTSPAVDLAVERDRKHREAAKQFLDRLSAEELTELKEAVLADSADPLVQTYRRNPTGTIAGVALGRLLIAAAKKRMSSES